MGEAKRGICHVCGRQGPLTFEHIPPHSTGNTQTARNYQGIEAAKQMFSDNPDFKGLKFRQSQRGNGFYCLCESCNNFLGRNYVRAFSDFYNAETYETWEHPYVPGAKGSVIEISDFHPLAFVKQVVSNFCSINRPGSMADCKRFLLDVENTELPERYRLFMYIIPDLSGRSSFAGWSMTIYGNNNNNVMRYVTRNPVSCVAAMRMSPFGFSLFDMSKSTVMPVQAGDITGMASCKWDVHGKVMLQLPLLHEHVQGALLS